MSSPFAITATLTITSYDRSEALMLKIDDSDQCTTVTGNNPGDIAAVALSLISLNDSYFNRDEPLKITHLGIIKKGARVATNQVRIKVTDIVKLPDIPLNILLSHVPVRQRILCKNGFKNDYKKISPKASEALFKALIKSCPEQESAINKIASKVFPETIIKNISRSDDAAVEKDALGICLDIFGIDRPQVFNSWRAQDRSLGTSFLSGLADYTSYEDDVISHDLHNVPGWNTVSETISGIVEFENNDGEKLTVINANRKPLEKAMGIDLIYFHRKYEAFTMVQYKMMDQKVNDIGAQYYNPNNSSHQEEHERMSKLFNLINQDEPSQELSDYRLTDCPIFFKVCRKLQLKSDDTSIAAGAYIPLTQWNILLRDPSFTGPKGGIQIGFHTLNKRYIGTQTFVDLIQRGFFGTQRISSLKIGAFVEDAINKGHSVMYAIEDKKQKASSIEGQNTDEDFEF